MKLLLAMDIADRLSSAARQQRQLDLHTEARALLARHPEAHASLDDVIAALADQLYGANRQHGRRVAGASH